MKISKLEIKLVNYFVLIAFAALLIGVEFYFEFNSQKLNDEIYASAQLEKPHKPGTENKRYILKPVKHVANKIFIMFVVLTVVVAIVLTMFIKNITMPLRGIVDVAKRINEGDLSQTVVVKSRDEIGEVGDAINELTSNFQEVTQLTTSTVKHAICGIEELERSIANNQVPDTNTIEDIKSSVLALNSFMETFKVMMPASENHDE